MQKDNNAKKGLFFWIRSSAWKRAGTVFLARKNLSLVFIQTVAFWAEIFNHLHTIVIKTQKGRIPFLI